MTITKHDRIAFIPTRCDRCNRLFIFEPYDFYYKEVGIERHSLKQVQCVACTKRFRGIMPYRPNMMYSDIDGGLHIQLKKEDKEEEKFRSVCDYSPNQMYPDIHGGFTYANKEKEE